MADNLIIVESPAKVKTISKFLGKSYTIDATMGHLIDMPKSSLGVDVENHYEPKYITIRGKGDLLSKLKKEAIRKGLSAGRVQSVALKMICDREAEIAAFVPEEYWTLEAAFSVGKKTLEASFYGKEKRIPLDKEETVSAIIKEIGKSKLTVVEKKQGERRKKAPLPFTTSTLQQEAAKLLSFPTQKTMRIAQKLYEGVNVKGRGVVGLITYLRTDSTRISDEAQQAVLEKIRTEYGEAYCQKKNREEKTDVKIQDAHEAIRPSYLEITPFEAKDSLEKDEYKLYQLIYKRFVASRMESAVYQTETIMLSAKDYIFTLAMEVGDSFSVKEWIKEQHFTQAPAHFTEASLVKALEEGGIGRPSTYAPTIATLLLRRYVTKEKKNIFVTELGNAVNEMMSQNFPTIVDKAFTANLESLLDSVSVGDTQWKTIVENFYPDLSTAVEKAREEVSKVDIKEEETDVVCDKCGRKMVLKYGPHGKFLACPGFPECKNTKPYVEYAGFLCPTCGAECVKKRSKKGRIFYSCSRYPECEYMTWQKPKDAVSGEKKEGEIMA